MDKPERGVQMMVTRARGSARKDQNTKAAGIKPQHATTANGIASASSDHAKRANRKQSPGGLKI
jgi:hypothetical protein